MSNKDINAVLFGLPLLLIGMYTVGWLIYRYGIETIVFGSIFLVFTAGAFYESFTEKRP